MQKKFFNIGPKPTRVDRLIGSTLLGSLQTLATKSRGLYYKNFYDCNLLIFVIS